MRNVLWYSLVLVVLAATGWAVDPPYVTATRYEAMYEAYEANAQRGAATLITSDSVLHTAHVLFDYTLRAAEVQKFNAALDEMTRHAADRMTQLAEEEAAKRYVMAPPPYGYDRVAAYYYVAKVLLGYKGPLPTIIADRVGKEVNLIMAAKDVTISPVLGVTEDYTQYKPRGHYTRNARFQMFFRAMMWYGHAGFPMTGEKAPGVPLTQEEARANAWASMTLARNLDQRPLYRMPNSPTLCSLWQSIYCPTAFIVGPSDDLTPPEIAALSVKIFGDTLPGGWTVDARAKTDQFIAEAAKLRPAKIVGTVQSDAEEAPPVSMKLMGQRYILDSDIFQQLVHKAVPGRYLPSGLDVMAALGSPLAQELQKAEFTNPTSGPAYTAQMAKLQAQVGALTEAQWQQTAYMLWLHTVRALALSPQVAVPGIPGGDRFPAWWNTPVWRAKQLNAALGSWAELRHDTILYAKQSYTLYAGISPQQPQYFVEPVPLVYGGIIRLLSATREQLERQGAFPQELASNYDEFTRLLRALLLISTDDIATLPTPGGFEKPTADDRERITRVASILKLVETLPEPLRTQLIGAEDARAALVADVHTDPNSKRVLEVAVGKVATISVPMTVGNQTVWATGPIFTYYEFPHPMADRLTDAQWQEMLDKGTVPAPARVIGEMLKR